VTKKTIVENNYVTRWTTLWWLIVVSFKITVEGRWEPEELKVVGEFLSRITLIEVITNQFDGVEFCTECIVRIRQLMSRSSAAYSLVILYKDSVYAVRDPFGNRPLAVGELVSTKHPG